MGATGDNAETLKPGMKLKYDQVIEGLRGIPVTNLVENWSFTIKEIAPYVFKAQGLDTKWHNAVGYGSTAGSALELCVRNAQKINMREECRLNVGLVLSKLIDKVLRIFGNQK